MAEELKPNDVASVVSVLKSVYPQLRIVILKEENVNTREKEDALIKFTASGETIFILDCGTVRDLKRLEWKNELKRELVLIYLKSKRVAVKDNVNERLIRHIFEDDIDVECQICSSPFAKEAERNTCSQCAFAYCHKCAMRMTLMLVVASEGKKFIITCPQCRADVSAVHGTVIDENNNLLIPAEYFKSISNNYAELEGLKCLLNLMAALLQHIYPNDAEAATLIAEILAHK